MLLKIAALSASRDQADSCFPLEHQLLNGMMARQACRCLALLVKQDVSRRAVIARMKGFTHLSQLLGQVPIAPRPTQGDADLLVLC